MTTRRTNATLCAVAPALRPNDLALDGPVTVEQWLGAPALSYPRRPGSVVEVLRQAARQWPETVAFVDETGASMTYREAAWAMDETAARLLGEYGLRRGDRVAVAGRNRLDMAIAVFACAAAGLLMVGLNTRLAAPQWEYMIDSSRASAAFGQAELIEQLRRAAGDRPVHLLDRENMSGLPHRTLRYGIDEAATYAVVWTSGTTGRPKGSQVVHRCSVHSAMSYQRVLRLRAGETTAVLFPLSYISAMHAHVLPAMLAGATSVLIETTSPRRWVELLAEHQVSWAYAVPSWWQLAVRDDRLDGRWLPALRVAGAGGAPFPPKLVAALRERLPSTRLIDIYGLSETHSPATMLLDHEFPVRPGSVGRPLPCMEIEIRADSGEVCKPGKAGEIWLRGSLVTSGYLDDPSATSQSIVDGWFRTGDLGRVDDEGYLFVLDRVKDMINRGGSKVFSAEVETLLREMPGVNDVAIVAAPDRLAGESVAAFVVRAEGHDVAAADVRRWVRDRMADYAAPSVVRFVDDLPCNPTGKVDKPALRRLFADAPD